MPDGDPVSLHVPLLLDLGGEQLSILHEHTADCASRRRGWFGHRRCDCGKPDDQFTADEAAIRSAARAIFQATT